jgi:hypothetical protein
MEISDLNKETTIHAEMTGPYEGSYRQTWSYDGTEFCRTDPEPSPFVPGSLGSSIRSQVDTNLLAAMTGLPALPRL